ncbi:uncharacterized protein [Physcomitrium patens]|uniref:Uncharacterized protein n=1 Tax=Physcomitrium patens TaxID=3218 RepID=A0A2K1LBC0_PHYPA|nr:hypothetical protein PHYPA_001751 [Physcomitrium patens]
MWELLGCIWKTVFAITLGNSSSGRLVYQLFVTKVGHMEEEVKLVMQKVQEMPLIEIQLHLASIESTLPIMAILSFLSPGQTQVLAEWIPSKPFSLSLTFAQILPSLQ